MNAAPVFISQILYDRAKALGYDMTGYAVIKPLPKMPGIVYKTVYSPPKGEA